MNDIPQEDFAKVIATQIGQTNLVIRCVVRALVQQPGFDAESFLKTLGEEEQKMSDKADLSKDVIKTIIAEVEGYT